ncbi:class I SAM-dependent methyltransferase [Paracoccus zhejiangensis]|uniref:SAM-dependent methyltransferase n=1 Tax=Paracoccus zhejiangensis TaxID=1077935 RepID=A0A2H5F2L9_9RHOB|nr:class I SAM-dependent methyltransferase [Paracoccus zhejiangensis]AUH65793.1 SAM-dependent methyltransferase [Paracoccus zhejiangensis]
MSRFSDDETLRFYAQSSSDYANEGAGRIWAGLSDFIALLPEGAEVLELGCGAGREAAALLAAGFRVDATDGSAEMVAEARARTGMTVRQMRFDELAVVARYDAVLANASLLHVPFAGLPEILVRVRRALRPGGVLVATFKTGGAAGRDAAGRYFNRPTREALETAFRSAGFDDLSIDQRHGGGYRGEPTEWLTVVARP